MEKYVFQVNVTSPRYVAVEADSTEEARSIVCRMCPSELEDVGEEWIADGDDIFELE